MCNDATRIISRIEAGDPAASDELLPLVYAQLRSLAGSKLAHENPGQTLQATALVHEAYLRLVDVDKLQRWDSRAHFFSAAAEAMRRILVENARRKKALRHGGDRDRLDVEVLEFAINETPDEVLSLHDALDSLAEKDPRKAELVKLRFFGGLTNEEAAQCLGISAATAYKDWAYARVWLRLETVGDQTP